MKKKFGLLVTIILSMLFLVACGGMVIRKKEQMLVQVLEKIL